MFYDSKADILLLMITATIPDKFKPYLLGFDASGDAVPHQAIGIHHPNGNVKRISYANNRQARLSLPWRLLHATSLMVRRATHVLMRNYGHPCTASLLKSAQQHPRIGMQVIDKRWAQRLSDTVGKYADRRK